MKWNPSRTVPQNVREKLPRQLSRFYAEGRAAIEHDDPAALHRFRLRGKRFRYTVELFRPVYGPGLDGLLSGLRRIQTFLGEINDCATTRNLLPDRVRFHEWLNAREAKTLAALRDYWEKEFDAPAVERRWQRYLRTYVRRKLS